MRGGVTVSFRAAGMLDGCRETDMTRTSCPLRREVDR